MNTDRELMQQALEKLEFFAHMKSVSEDTRRLIATMRERLAQPAPMKSVYVVMATFDSPIAFVIPSPKFVFAKRKDAEKFCNEHNAKRTTRNTYYVRKAEPK